MKISQNAKKAIYIGTLCSIAYFAVYIARNALSAATPQMLAAGYTEAYIGSVSSLFFVFYAVGQLINGWIGDHIQAKWMISGGLLFAAVANALFPYLGKYPTLAMIIFAFSGFFLSMIYGPMTKVVAENTEPLHATRCSIGYTFASFFGSPAAGILASLFVWQSVFTVSSAAMLIMAVCVVVFFLHFERRGFVRYGQYRAKEKGTGNIKQLFKLQIVKFSLVSILTGIVRTSVVFWLPTYISQYLEFPAKTAVSIFTVATFVISCTTFIAVFVFERLKQDLDKTMLVMFVSSSVFFLLSYFVKAPIPNVIFMVLAIMSSNGAASMLYGKYCPSLRDTGMVSSVTGFIDFLSYISAAAANIIFANAATSIGWGNLILVWFGIVFLGVLLSFPFSKRRF
jgi:sugar phosphate permease